MELIYDKDVNSPTFGTCDISWSKGDPLTSAVLMSIFSKRRVTIEEVPIGDRRYGYFLDTKERKLGSKMWLLTRKSITPDILPKIKLYLEESLAWMIEDKVAADIVVQVYQSPTNPDRIDSVINIIKHSGSVHSFNFDDVWNQLTTN